MLAPIPPSPLLIQLPAKVPEKPVKDRIPEPPMEIWMEAPGSWHQAAPALAAVWKVNQGMENIYLSVCLSISI